LPSVRIVNGAMKSTGESVEIRGVPNRAAQRLSPLRRIVLQERL
jgi:hypothetical protein